MAATACSGCDTSSASGSTEPRPAPASSVTITPFAALPVGLASPLAATVRDASGAVVTGAPITWQSSDTTRALIDAGGFVIARAAGTVTITAQSGTLSGSAALTIAAAPSPAACRVPRSLGTVAFGFPRDASRLRSTGTVRFTVLFVDYPDAVATRTTQALFDLMAPGAVARFTAFSYGRMTATLTPTHGWLRLPRNSTAYGFADGLTFAEHRTLLQDAANLGVAAGVDFSLTDALVVISNPDAPSVSFGPAFVASPGFGIAVPGREILNGTNSGADFLGWGGAGWLVHEIGHTLGLPDLYDFSPGTTGAHRHVGEWSQMGLISGRGPEWTGVERWQLGWLDDADVVCAPPSGTLLAPVAPLVGSGSAQRLILVPLSTTQVLAIESRRATGFDAGLAQPGLLVYTVDAAVATGRGTMRVLPIQDTDNAKLGRTLTVGQSITHAGVTVTFVSASPGRDVVRVAR